MSSIHRILQQKRLEIRQNETGVKIMKPQALFNSPIGSPIGRNHFSDSPAPRITKNGNAPVQKTDGAHTPYQAFRNRHPQFPDRKRTHYIRRRSGIGLKLVRIPGGGPIYRERNTHRAVSGMPVHYRQMAPLDVKIVGSCPKYQYFAERGSCLRIIDHYQGGRAWSGTLLPYFYI